jgi:hypothetical protein
MTHQPQELLAGDKQADAELGSYQLEHNEL